MSEVGLGNLTDLSQKNFFFKIKLLVMQLSGRVPMDSIPSIAGGRGLTVQSNYQLYLISLPQPMPSLHITFYL